MAVENKYVTHNASAKAIDVGPGVLCSGGVVKCVPFSFETAAADDDGSIYRIARVSGRAIPLGIKFLMDAIANLTDSQIGIYKPLDKDGSVIDVDCLAVSVDIHAGYATQTEMLIPTGVAQDEVGKDLLALADVAEASKQKYGDVDVAITTPAGATGAGTIAGYFFYIDGVGV
ncbi:MAG: hypothetical protein WC551_10470 [Patescibacteria group bacterium]